ncbi:MAG: hypothetical protein M0Z59_01620 [Nitrospiraceae bacterium]|nr:hypothetical protein [Nitrospiraceae bacterium]
MEKWFALYLKPKNELIVSMRLKQAGIRTLSPLINQKRFRDFRVVESVEPLFPCYIFACFDPAAHYRLISYTRGVRYIVGRESPVPVSREIIKTIEERMVEGVITVEPERMEKGQEVIFSEGPFAGLRGIFERYTRGYERAVILLEAMGWKLETDTWPIKAGTAGHSKKYA